eukprot:PhM_4_TR10806/c0_g1_i1/m.52570
MINLEYVSETSARAIIVDRPQGTALQSWSAQLWKPRQEISEFEKEQEVHDNDQPERTLSSSSSPSSSALFNIPLLALTPNTRYRLQVTIYVIQPLGPCIPTRLDPSGEVEFTTLPTPELYRVLVLNSTCVELTWINYCSRMPSWKRESYHSDVEYEVALMHSATRKVVQRKCTLDTSIFFEGLDAGTSYTVQLRTHTLGFHSVYGCYSAPKSFTTLHAWDLKVISRGFNSLSLRVFRSAADAATVAKREKKKVHIQEAKSEHADAPTTTAAAAASNSGPRKSVVRFMDEGGSSPTKQSQTSSSASSPLSGGIVVPKTFVCFENDTTEEKPTTDVEESPTAARTGDIEALMSTTEPRAPFSHPIAPCTPIDCTGARTELMSMVVILHRTRHVGSSSSSSKKKKKRSSGLSDGSEDADSISSSMVSSADVIQEVDLDTHECTLYDLPIGCRFTARLLVTLRSPSAGYDPNSGSTSQLYDVYDNDDEEHIVEQVHHILRISTVDTARTNEVAYEYAVATDRESVMLYSSRLHLAALSGKETRRGHHGAGLSSIGSMLHNKDSSKPQVNPCESIRLHHVSDVAADVKWGLKSTVNARRRSSNAVATNGVTLFRIRAMELPRGERHIPTWFTLREPDSFYGANPEQVRHINASRFGSEWVVERTIAHDHAPHYRLSGLKPDTRYVVNMCAVGHQNRCLPWSGSVTFATLRHASVKVVNVAMDAFECRLTPSVLEVETELSEQRAMKAANEKDSSNQNNVSHASKSSSSDSSSDDDSDSGSDHKAQDTNWQRLQRRVQFRVMREEDGTSFECNVDVNDRHVRANGGVFRLFKPGSTGGAPLDLSEGRYLISARMCMYDVATWGQWSPNAWVVVRSVPSLDVQSIDTHGHVHIRWPQIAAEQFPFDRVTRAEVDKYVENSTTVQGQFSITPVNAIHHVATLPSIRGPILPEELRTCCVVLPGLQRGQFSIKVVLIDIVTDNTIVSTSGGQVPVVRPSSLKVFVANNISTLHTEFERLWPFGVSCNEESLQIAHLHVNAKWQNDDDEKRAIELHQKRLDMVPRAAHPNFLHMLRRQQGEIDELPSGLLDVSCDHLSEEDNMIALRTLRDIRTLAARGATDGTCKHLEVHLSRVKAQQLPHDADGMQIKSTAQPDEADDGDDERTFIHAVRTDGMIVMRKLLPRQSYDVRLRPVVTELSSDGNSRSISQRGTWSPSIRLTTSRKLLVSCTSVGQSYVEVAWARPPPWVSRAAAHGNASTISSTGLMRLSSQSDLTDGTVNTAVGGDVIEVMREMTTYETHVERGVRRVALDAKTRVLDFRGQRGAAGSGGDVVPTIRSSTYVAALYEVHASHELSVTLEGTRMTWTVHLGESESSLLIDNLRPGLRYSVRARQARTRWGRHVTVQTLTDMHVWLTSLGSDYCTVCCRRAELDVADESLHQGSAGEGHLSNSSVRGREFDSAPFSPDGRASNDSESDEEVDAVTSYEIRVECVQPLHSAAPRSFTFSPSEFVDMENLAKSDADGSDLDESEVYYSYYGSEGMRRALKEHRRKKFLRPQSFSLNDLAPGAAYNVRVRVKAQGNLWGTWQRMCQFRTMPLLKFDFVRACEDVAELAWDPLPPVNVNHSKSAPPDAPPVPSLFAAERLVLVIQGMFLKSSARQVLQDVPQQEHRVHSLLQKRNPLQPYETREVVLSIDEFDDADTMTSSTDKSRQASNEQGAEGSQSSSRRYTIVEGLFPDTVYSVWGYYKDTRGFTSACSRPIRFLTLPLLGVHIDSIGETFAILSAWRAPRRSESKALIEEVTEKRGEDAKMHERRSEARSALHQNWKAGDYTDDMYKQFLELQRIQSEHDGLVHYEDPYDEEYELQVYPTRTVSADVVPTRDEFIRGVDPLRCRVEERRDSSSSNRTHFFLGELMPNEVYCITVRARVTWWGNPKHFYATEDVVSAGGMSTLLVASGVMTDNKFYSSIMARRRVKPWCGMWSDVLSINTLRAVQARVMHVGESWLLISLHRPDDFELDEVSSKRRSFSSNSLYDNTTVFQFRINGKECMKEVSFAPGSQRQVLFRHLYPDTGFYMEVRSRYETAAERDQQHEKNDDPMTHSRSLSEINDAEKGIPSWLSAARTLQQEEENAKEREETRRRRHLSLPAWSNYRHFLEFRTLPRRPGMPRLYEHRPGECLSLTFSRRDRNYSKTAKKADEDAAQSPPPNDDVVERQQQAQKDAERKKKLLMIVEKERQRQEMEEAAAVAAATAAALEEDQESRTNKTKKRKSKKKALSMSDIHILAEEDHSHHHYHHHGEEDDSNASTDSLLAQVPTWDRAAVVDDRLGEEREDVAELVDTFRLVFHDTLVNVDAEGCLVSLEEVAVGGHAHEPFYRHLMQQEARYVERFEVEVALRSNKHNKQQHHHQQPHHHSDDESEDYAFVPIGAVLKPFARIHFSSIEKKLLSSKRRVEAPPLQLHDLVFRLSVNNNILDEILPTESIDIPVKRRSYYSKVVGWKEPPTPPAVVGLRAVVHPHGGVDVHWSYPSLIYHNQLYFSVFVERVDVETGPEEVARVRHATKTVLTGLSNEPYRLHVVPVSSFGTGASSATLRFTPKLMLSSTPAGAAADASDLETHSIARNDWDWVFPNDVARDWHPPQHVSPFHLRPQYKLAARQQQTKCTLFLPPRAALDPPAPRPVAPKAPPPRPATSTGAPVLLLLEAPPPPPPPKPLEQLMVVEAPPTRPSSAIDAEVAAVMRQRQTTAILEGHGGRIPTAERGTHSPNAGDARPDRGVLRSATPTAGTDGPSMPPSRDGRGVRFRVPTSEETHRTTFTEVVEQLLTTVTGTDACASAAVSPRSTPITFNSHDEFHDDQEFGHNPNRRDRRPPTRAQTPSMQRPPTAAATAMIDVRPHSAVGFRPSSQLDKRRASDREDAPTTTTNNDNSGAGHARARAGPRGGTRAQSVRVRIEGDGAADRDLMRFNKPVPPMAAAASRATTVKVGAAAPPHAPMPPRRRRRNDGEHCDSSATYKFLGRVRDPERAIPASWRKQSTHYYPLHEHQSHNNQNQNQNEINNNPTSDDGNAVAICAAVSDVELRLE